MTCGQWAAVLSLIGLMLSVVVVSIFGAPIDYVLGAWLVVGVLAFLTYTETE